MNAIYLKLAAQSALARINPSCCMAELQSKHVFPNPVCHNFRYIFNSG